MKADLDKWLDGLRSRHADVVIVLQLHNCRDDGQTNLVDKWDLPPSLDFSGTIAEIERTAEKDAELLVGEQRYAVIAFVDKVNQGRRLFKIDASEGDVTRTPNQTGALGLMMDHCRDQQKLIMGLVKSAHGGLMQENMRLQKANETLMSRDETRSVELEKITSAAHERHLAEKRAEHDMQLKQEIVHGLRMLAPYATGLAVAGDSPKGNVTELDLQAIQAFLESLRPEQVAAIQDSLNPFQATGLMAMWQKFVAERKSSAGK
jgi:hypothetical protein